MGIRKSNPTERTTSALSPSSGKSTAHCMTMQTGSRWNAGTHGGRSSPIALSGAGRFDTGWGEVLGDFCAGIAGGDWRDRSTIVDSYRQQRLFTHDWARL